MEVVGVRVEMPSNSPIVLREAAVRNIEIIKALYSLKTGQVTRLTG